MCGYGKQIFIKSINKKRNISIKRTTFWYNKQFVKFIKANILATVLQVFKNFVFVCTQMTSPHSKMQFIGLNYKIYGTVL